MKKIFLIIFILYSSSAFASSFEGICSSGLTVADIPGIYITSTSTLVRRTYANATVMQLCASHDNTDCALVTGNNGITIVDFINATNVLVNAVNITGKGEALIIGFSHVGAGAVTGSMKVTVDGVVIYDEGNVTLTGQISILTGVYVGTRFVSILSTPIHFLTSLLIQHKSNSASFHSNVAYILR